MMVKYFRVKGWILPVCLFCFFACQPLSVFGGGTSVGTYWTNTMRTTSYYSPRPVYGIKGYILLSLPYNMAQYQKGDIYHTHQTGSTHASEILVWYWAPLTPSSYGGIFFRQFRWAPITYTTNRLTGGDFGTSTGWTVTTGWTISGGKATHSGTSTTPLTRSDCTGIVGRREETIFQISDYASGSITVSFGGKESGVYSSDGTKTDSYRITSTDPIVFNPSNSFSGSIDNVQVLTGDEHNFKNLKSDTDSSTEPIGFTNNMLTISSNGSVTTAAAPYITNINIGTETKKALYFENVMVFAPISPGTTTGTWMEYTRLKNHETRLWDTRWGHQWDGDLMDVHELPFSGSFPGWGGTIETFGSSYGSGSASVGNHIMDWLLPTGEWSPFGLPGKVAGFFSLKKTDTSTGLTIYNPNASAGSWLAHVP